MPVHLFKPLIESWTLDGVFWFLIEACIVWHVSGWLDMYWNRPKGVYIGGTSVLLGGWLTSLEFVLDGAGIIADVYRRMGAKHSAFAIPALGQYQVLVSTEQQIKELGRCPERVLSFNHAMDQRLRHKYTMFGFDDHAIDPEHTLVARVLKVHLRTSIPTLQAGLQSALSDTIRNAVFRARSGGPGAIIRGAGAGTEAEAEPEAPGGGGWKHVSAASFAREVTARANNQVLVGADLAASPAFDRATVRYNQDVVVAMELCRHLPSILVPFVSTAIMWWSGAMKEVARAVTSLVEERLREDGEVHSEKIKRRDCVGWIMACSRTPAQKTVLRMVQQTLALMFASAHQIAMALVYAIYSLCMHPEYITPLRREIEQAQATTKDFAAQFDHLPLMDSFLRESARLHPLDALSIQRLCMTPYTFRDNGPYLPAGTLVAVPQEAVMRDPKNYANAHVFDGRRFVVSDEPDAQGRGIPRACPRLTDVSWKFPYWGSEKRACPGRWYVSAILKQILVNMLMSYDFELARTDVPRSFIWTTAIIPHPRMTLLVRERQEKPKIWD